MEYLKINSELINCYEIGQLTDRQFRDYFNGIKQGETNKLSKYIVMCYDRLPWKEWDKIRKIVFKRDDYICQYCGKKDCILECDHIVPLSSGGTHKISNLNTACMPCNRAKKDKIAKDYNNVVV